MRKVILSDVTLRESESSASHSLSFKEKIEIAKQMDKLHCDIIEMPKIKNTSTDVLLIKTIASLMKHSEIAVDAGMQRGKRNREGQNPQHGYGTGFF